MLQSIISYSFGNPKIPRSSLKIARHSLKKGSIVSRTRFDMKKLNSFHHLCLRERFVLFAGVQLKPTYKELIRKIELFSQVLYFVMCITLAILFISVAPYSYVRYYIFNMEADSFLLFGPAWFVFTTKQNELNECKMYEYKRK